MRRVYVGASWYREIRRIADHRFAVWWLQPLWCKPACEQLGAESTRCACTAQPSSDSGSLVRFFGFPSLLNGQLPTKSFYEACMCVCGKVVFLCLSLCSFWTRDVAATVNTGCALFLANTNLRRHMSLAEQVIWNDVKKFFTEKERHQ